MTSDEQWRASFDAVVTFGNGGGLQVQGFRLDLPDEAVTDAEIAELFVGHLGLLMVESVTLSEVRRIPEAHKGSRGVPVRPRPDGGRRVVELSHVIRDGMVTLPGLPGPVLSEHLSREGSRAVYAPGTEFHIGRIEMVANTGTYLDTPFHRYPDGFDLAGLPLDRCVDLDGVVVRVTGQAGRAVDRAALAPHEVAGRAVLIHTGWDRHFGTPAYGTGHPYLTADAVDWLVAQGAALVGIDSLNIDEALPGGDRPAHSGLLAAGIPIVEHLRGLEALPPTGFRFFAAPPAVEAMGTFPVRAFALL